jgi:hypothetical protein
MNTTRNSTMIFTEAGNKPVAELETPTVGVVEELDPNVDVVNVVADSLEPVTVTVAAVAGVGPVTSATVTATLEPLMSVVVMMNEEGEEPAAVVVFSMTAVPGVVLRVVVPGVTAGVAVSSGAVEGPVE